MVTYYRFFDRLARLDDGSEICETYNWRTQTWQQDDVQLAKLQRVGDWDELSEADALAYIQGRLQGGPASGPTDRRRAH